MARQESADSAWCSFGHASDPACKAISSNPTRASVGGNVESIQGGGEGPAAQAPGSPGSGQGHPVCPRRAPPHHASLPPAPALGSRRGGRSPHPPAWASRTPQLQPPPPSAGPGAAVTGAGVAAARARPPPPPAGAPHCPSLARSRTRHRGQRCNDCGDPDPRLPPGHGELKAERPEFLKDAAGRASGGAFPCLSLPSVRGVPVKSASVPRHCDCLVNSLSR